MNSSIVFHKSVPACLIFFLFYFLTGTSLLAQASLVRDINPGSTSSLGSRKMATLNGKLIFTATTDTYGSELYMSDGTSSGTVLLKDINPGPSGSAIQNLHATTGYVFFFADNGTNGLEVWRTDGTSEGTILINDLAAGSASGISSAFFGKGALASDSNFYFIAGLSSKSLYKTNGEAGNMELIKSSEDLKDILGFHHGNLYFTQYYYGGNYVSSLWETDGTPAGTHKVKQVNVNFSGIYDYFITLDSNIYFVLNTPAEGAELWKSDGTEAGTALVKDVVPGAAGSIVDTWTDFYVWNNEIYFVVFHGPNVQELWKTDGTETGTVLVKTLPNRNESLAPGSGRLEMLGLASLLVFTTYNDSNGFRDLWVTDGTEAGTTLLAGGEGGNYFSPVYLTLFENKAFFSAKKSPYGQELFKSDGTVAGTMLAADVYVGTSGSSPGRMTVLDSTLYFAASSFNTGNELFRYRSPIVSLSEAGASNLFGVFPNPAGYTLHVQADKNIGSLRLTNSMGTVVYSAFVDDMNYTFTTEGLPDGVYFLSTETGTKTVILQKK